MSARTHVTSPPGALRGLAPCRMGLALWMLTALAAMALSVALAHRALDVATPLSFGLAVGFLASELLLVRLDARASVVRAALRG